MAREARGMSVVAGECPFISFPTQASRTNGTRRFAGGGGAIPVD